MPRRPRLAAGDLAYHVLNRRVGRLPLFDKPADYAAFEKILAEAQTQTKIRIDAYCLIPNHCGGKEKVSGVFFLTRLPCFR
jgi:putative transposase